MTRETTNLTVTVAGIAALAVVAGAIWFGLGDSQAAPVPPTVPGIEAVREPQIRVHVAGAVVSPGVVEVPADAIVADAVAAAGGATRSGDLASINLAASVRPGERIVVPEFRADGLPAASGTDSGIDINTATASELESLPGVGPVLAGRIVAHRTEHGPFVTIEDLLDVPGIGESKLASMRDAISRP